jgi:hypothetical protein
MNQMLHDNSLIYVRGWKDLEFNLVDTSCCSLNIASQDDRKHYRNYLYDDTARPAHENKKTCRTKKKAIRRLLDTPRYCLRCGTCRQSHALNANKLGAKLQLWKPPIFSSCQDEGALLPRSWRLPKMSECPVIASPDAIRLDSSQ